MSKNNKIKKAELGSKGPKNRALNGGNDDYFTSVNYAGHCCSIIKKKLYRYKIEAIIEPSAGSGSFYSGLLSIIGTGAVKLHMIDICPKTSKVELGNFFDLDFDGKNTLVVGNPPFGFASRLAVKFFNHAAKNRAKIIAFILPRTFQKLSIKNRLDDNYEQVYEEVCPKDVFILNGQPYNVPCVFQIWVRSKNKRVMEIWPTENPWVEFTTPDKATFCIRRVGGRAGKVLLGDPAGYSTSSTYFCREKQPGVRDVLAGLDFSGMVNSTAGVRSISKAEIHKVLYNFYHGGY